MDTEIREIRHALKQLLLHLSVNSDDPDRVLREVLGEVISELEDELSKRSAKEVLVRCALSLQGGNNEARH